MTNSYIAITTKHLMRYQFPFLLLAAAIAFSGCNDDEEVAPSGGGGGGGGGGTTGALTTNTAVSVQMNVDGTNVSYTDGSVYTYGNGSGGNVTTPPDLSTKEYDCFFYNINDDSQVLFSVKFGLLQYSGGMPDNTTFLGYFPTGPVTFGNTSTALDRVSISWWNSQGEWSTACGSGSQSGSSLQITEVVDVPQPFNYTMRKMRITFNCKLYNCSTGAMKTVTGGTAVLLYQNI